MTDINCDRFGIKSEKVPAINECLAQHTVVTREQLQEAANLSGLQALMLLEYLGLCRLADRYTIVRHEQCGTRLTAARVQVSEHALPLLNKHFFCAHCCQYADITDLSCEVMFVLTSHIQIYACN